MEASQKKFAKLFLRMAVGGLAGFAAMKFGLDGALGPLLRGAGLGGTALAATGLVLALMGLFVGLGAAIPGLGARTLNVSGREDIEDQQAMLIGSGVSCVALGLGMILLALATPAGPVPAALGLSAFAFGLILTTAITALQWSSYDELWRRMSLEGAAWGGTLLSVCLLGWAALALTGRAVLPDPAGLIALIMTLTLVGCFIAAGRRGMLTES